MREHLDGPISVRLSPTARQRCMVAAAERRMSLSQYVRERIEIDDHVAEQIKLLRLTILDLGLDQSQGAIFPIVLELLLLMRRQVSPGDSRAGRLELERQGIAPWTPGPA